MRRRRDRGRRQRKDVSRCGRDRTVVVGRTSAIRSVALTGAVLIVASLRAGAGNVDGDAAAVVASHRTSLVEVRLRGSWPPGPDRKEQARSIAGAFERRIEFVAERLGDHPGGAPPLRSSIRLDVYPTPEAKGLAMGVVEPLTIGDGYVRPRPEVSAGSASEERASMGGGEADRETDSALVVSVVVEGAVGVRGSPVGRAAALVAARATWGEAASPAMEHGLSIVLGDPEARDEARFFAAWIDAAGETTPVADLLDGESWRRRSILVQSPLAVVLVEAILEADASWGGREGLAAAWRGRPADLAVLEAAYRGRLATLRESRTDAMRERRERRGASRGRLDLRGFCLAHEGYAIHDGYLSAQAGRSMERVAAMGANAVSITPFGFYRGLDQPVFRWSAHPDPRHAGGENDVSIRVVLGRARSLGFVTMLKPHLWGHAGWCGDLRMKSAADWDAWFETYGEFLVHHALLAETEEADWLSIGCELRHATREFPDRWAALADRARRLFAGGLTYAANWADEVDWIAFAGRLDALGVDAYAPLSMDDAPTDAALGAGARGRLAELDALGRRLGKPILLTEVGYPAREACWKDPYREERGGRRSALAQERCTRAFVEAMGAMLRFGGHDRAVRGFFLWKWPTLERWAEDRADYWPASEGTEQAWRRAFRVGGEA